MQRNYDYQPGQYWDQLHRAHPGSRRAVGIPSLGDAFNELTYRTRVQTLREQIRDVGGTPREPTVLEVGVGIGAYAELWAELGARHWVGADVSPTAVAALQRAFGRRGTFVCADVSSRDAWHLPELQQEFSLVTLIDVLYHIMDDDGFCTALRAAAERVTSGGLLVVSDVFLSSPVATSAHVRRRPLSWYDELVGALGMRRLDRRSVFAFLAEPPRQSSEHASAATLRLAWRALQGALRRVPERWRSAPTRAALAPLLPLDRYVACRLPPGVNLELALYQRT